MNEHLLDLRQRRGVLLARIEQQRSVLREQIGRLDELSTGLDTLTAAAQWSRRHPWVPIAGLALLAWRRRGIAGVLRRGWWLWGVYRWTRSRLRAMPK